jgi:hypothetical protein
MGIRDAGRPALVAIAVLSCVGLLAPSGAAAANVVNGGFESGTLQGWDVHRATEVGNWFAYKGSAEPITRPGGEAFKVQAPPQGLYAAIADQLNPETLVLSQNVALGPGLEHRLSLLAYYDSHKALTVPSPDTLSVDPAVLGEQANQQYRIDVMRPTAAIESVDPADVLLTVFRTQPGDPKVMGPTRLTANLTPFAGQTVKLRFAVVAQKEVLAGGVDAVAVESAPPGQLPPLRPGSGKLGFGKAKANPKNGSAILPVRVPGRGSVKAKSTAKLIKPASAKAAAAGTVKLRLKPTAKALATLRRKHKLRVKVAVTFAPTGGRPETAIATVVLKLKAPPRHRP